MRKMLAATFALVALGLVACSGGGSDPYNFNGRWMVTSTITKNTCGSTALQGQLQIAESGGRVIVEVPATGTTPARIGNGIADTDAKTILFDIPGSQGVVRWDGRGMSEDSMSGTRKAIERTCEFEATWTAILISR